VFVRILDGGRKKILHEIDLPRRLAPGDLEFFSQAGKLGIAPGLEFGMEPDIPFKGKFIGHAGILAGCRSTWNQIAVFQSTGNPMAFNFSGELIFVQGIAYKT
jgi:hypothetical protein